MPSQSSHDVAIVGAGIAGFVFAIACENAGLNYTMYESGPEIWQHGSGIGLAINAMQALALIDETLPKSVDKISSQDAVHTAGFYYRHGQDGESWKAFDLIQRVTTEGATTVARSTFINEIVPYVPAHKINFGKHLINIAELSSGQTQLTFKDGTSAVHDVVVGCDGIHSKVRMHILGKEDPDATPRFTGKIVHRATVQTSDTHGLIEEDASGGVQVFLGRDGHIVFIPMDGGSKISITGVASRRTWDHEKWVAESSAEVLKNDYVGWDERLVNVLGKADHADIWALFDLPYPRTFVKGSVAMLGDAAHASTPFQGNGSAMAIEDAYILANLLAHTVGQGPGVIRKALEAYDAVRKPRSQKQVHTAMETGWIMDLQHPSLGNDIEAIKHALSTRLQWLWSVDLKAELDAAIESMQTR